MIWTSFSTNFSSNETINIINSATGSRTLSASLTWLSGFSTSQAAILNDCGKLLLVIPLELLVEVQVFHFFKKLAEDFHRLRMEEHASICEVHQGQFAGLDALPLEVLNALQVAGVLLAGLDLLLVNLVLRRQITHRGDRDVVDVRDGLLVLTVQIAKLDAEVVNQHAEHTGVDVGSLREGLQVLSELDAVGLAVGLKLVLDLAHGSGDVLALLALDGKAFVKVLESGLVGVL